MCACKPNQMSIVLLLALLFHLSEKLCTTFYNLTHLNNQIKATCSTSLIPMDFSRITLLGMPGSPKIRFDYL